MPDRPGQPVHLFVLGTGRCGTKTLATMLSRIPGCRVEHERPPPLLGEVTALIRGSMTDDDMVALLRDTRSPDAIGGDRVSGESNQRLSFIVPTLARAFPGARLLWIVRDGRENVASVHHRRWYDPREPELRQAHHAESAANRILGPDVGDIERARWDAMSGFERCCWYWSYTNRAIEQATSGLTLPTLCVRLEDLSARLDELLAFLGLPGDTQTELRAWNAARHGLPLPTRHWSDAQRKAFETICGPVMDRHYPGWRADGWDRAPSVIAWAHRCVYAVKQRWTVHRIHRADRARGTR